jgi:hypothetical protein
MAMERTIRFMVGEVVPGPGMRPVLLAPQRCGPRPVAFVAAR